MAAFACCSLFSCCSHVETEDPVEWTFADKLQFFEVRPSLVMVHKSNGDGMYAEELEESGVDTVEEKFVVFDANTCGQTHGIVWADAEDSDAGGDVEEDKVVEEEQVSTKDSVDGSCSEKYEVVEDEEASHSLENYEVVEDEEASHSLAD